MDDYIKQMTKLRDDIRDLKTAQPKPSILTTYYKSGTMQAGYYSEGEWTWTIHYDNEGSTDAPITEVTMPYFLKPYNAADNTQQIEWVSAGERLYVDDIMDAMSSRKITSITQDRQPSQSQWNQLLAFYPADMGSAPGMCLLNVMQGFHIAPWSGGSAGAYEDMLRNQQLGTLHAEIYPPNEIACPIYIRTGAPHEHIVAWDHGTVYSDGVIIDNWVQYYGAANIYGWGEYCDGIRVVEEL